MLEGKNSFILYTEYLKHVQKMDMAQRGELFTAILCHAAGEPLPELDAAADMAFSFIREQMDRDALVNSNVLKNDGLEYITGCTYTSCIDRDNHPMEGRIREVE